MKRFGSAAAAAIACACASTAPLPDLTGHSTEQVQTLHREFFSTPGVRRVLYGGEECYLFVGNALEDSDETTPELRQAAVLDARVNLVAHLVTPQERNQRELQMAGAQCPYEWRTERRLWAGCIVALGDVRVVPRAAPTTTPVNVLAEPSSSALPPSLRGRKPAASPIEPHEATAPPELITEVSSPSHDQPAGLLAHARRLAARGDCTAALAAYDALLESFPAFSVRQGVIEEKFRAQRMCP